MVFKVGCKEGEFQEEWESNHEWREGLYLQALAKNPNHLWLIFRRAVVRKIFLIFRKLMINKMFVCKVANGEYFFRKGDFVEYLFVISFFGVDSTFFFRVWKAWSDLSWYELKEVASGEGHWCRGIAERLTAANHYKMQSWLWILN